MYYVEQDGDNCLNFCQTKKNSMGSKEDKMTKWPVKCTNAAPLESSRVDVINNDYCFMFSAAA